MPKLSQTSFSRLSTCHLELQTLFYEVIRHMDCIIIEGHRNQEDQEDAFQKGESKIQWPNGKHNAAPSMAVDVAPYPINWTDMKSYYYLGGLVIGIAQRLKEEGKMTYSVRWGGDWNRDSKFDDQHFNDLGHFELV